MAQETAAHQAEFEDLAGVVNVQAAALAQAETLRQQMQDHLDQVQRQWQQRLEEQAAAQQEAREHLRVQMTEAFQAHLAAVAQEWQHDFTHLQIQQASLVVQFQAEQVRRLRARRRTTSSTVRHEEGTGPS